MRGGGNGRENVIKKGDAIRVVLVTTYNEIFENQAKPGY